MQGCKRVSCVKYFYVFISATPPLPPNTEADTHKKVLKWLYPSVSGVMHELVLRLSLLPAMR